MDNKFQNKYRIPSARATFHDYNGGAYFVTICTKNREHFFGKILCCMDVACRDAACHVSTETMQLSEIGKYTDELLHNISIHNPYCEIALYVIMPNHIHAIVVIDGEKIPYDRRDTACHVSTNKNKKMQEIANLQGWLSVTIGGFKSAVTKFANENNIEFSWQTRFHDRIIRNQDEMNRIAEYIENNVANWETDELNQ